MSSPVARGRKVFGGKVGPQVLISLFRGTSRVSKELVTLRAGTPPIGFANIRGDRAGRVAKLEVVQQLASRGRDQVIHIVDYCTGSIEHTEIAGHGAMFTGIAPLS